MDDKIPYVVYESAMTRADRHIKRLVIALVVAILMIFASNAIWLYSWMQYDYVSADHTTTVDADGSGIANYIGSTGDITNGKNYSETQD